MCGGGRRQSPTACHAVASPVYMLRILFCISVASTVVSWKRWICPSGQSSATSNCLSLRLNVDSHSRAYDVPETQGRDGQQSSHVLNCLGQTMRPTILRSHTCCNTITSGDTLNGCFVSYHISDMPSHSLAHVVPAECALLLSCSISWCVVYNRL